MNEIQSIHREAMENVDLATIARMKGDEDLALHLLKKAFELEAKAATSLEDSINKEPSRSVLYRSAATLAYKCKLYPDAERLIYKALLGQPPTEIVVELRDLLDQITF